MQTKNTLTLRNCLYCGTPSFMKEGQSFCKPAHRSLHWQGARQRQLLEWKEVITEGLMVAGIYQSRFDSEPREALAALIAWEISIALDPQVSSAAQALIDKGKAEAQKDLVDNPAELS